MLRDVEPFWSILHLRLYTGPFINTDLLHGPHILCDKPGNPCICRETNFGLWLWRRDHQVRACCPHTFYIQAEQGCVFLNISKAFQMFATCIAAICRQMENLETQSSTGCGRQWQCELPLLQDGMLERYTAHQSWSWFLVGYGLEWTSFVPGYGIRWLGKTWIVLIQYRNWSRVWLQAFPSPKWVDLFSG